MIRVRERQLHTGPRAGLAARRQVGDLAGAVAFQERRADGGRDGARARLVRPDEKVQTGLQALQHHWLADLAAVFKR
ncbi:hypothetical protein G6F68_021274 [Rhizopus microsporus]|nr:hypothetical protein G6F68_021274 [Rhizopus microsporus]